MAASKPTTKQQVIPQVSKPVAEGKAKSSSQSGPDKRVSAAQRTKQYAQQLGICATCAHQAQCLFVRATRQPIQFCEEFNDTLSPGQALPSDQPKLAQAFKAGQGCDPGICLNCETRLTCIHRQPGKTVYECEDYQ